MEESGRDRMLVETKLCTDPRSSKRVVDELLSGTACLACVRAFSELERSSEQVFVDVRVVRLDLSNHLLDEVFVVSFRVEDAHGSLCDS